MLIFRDGKNMLLADLKKLLSEHLNRKKSYLNFFTPDHRSVTAVAKLIKSQERFDAVSDELVIRCFLSNIPKENNDARALFIKIIDHLFPRNLDDKQRNQLIHGLLQCHYDNLTKRQEPIQAIDMKKLYIQYCTPNEKNEEDCLIVLEPF